MGHRNIHFEYMPSLVHLTCTTEQNEYLALCSQGAEIRETKTRVWYIVALTVGSDDIIDTKTLNLAVWSFLPCVFNLLLRIVESGSTLSNNF